MKKYLYSLLVMGLALTSIVQSTYAVLEETVSVAGTSFSVGVSNPGGGGTTGNTALKFLINPSGGTTSTNLTDTINGPDFENIDQVWTGDIKLKLHNKGTKTMAVVSKSEYINDPNTLRDDIFVQVREWNDTNNNGNVDSGEEGQIYGYDSILRWKNDTFPIGNVQPGQTKGVLLRFDGSGITESNVGMTAVYDFRFTGVEQAQ